MNQELFNFFNKKRLFLVLILLVFSMVFYFNFSLTGKATDSGIVKVRLPGGEENITNETVPSPSGGGSSKKICEASWRCYLKNACSNLEEDYEKGKIESSFFLLVESKCSLLGLNSTSCGYKNWECFDLNACEDNSTKPSPWEACIYPEGESCFDGFRNQNEEMVDCGGVCEPCLEYPIQEEGEFRIIYSSLDVGSFYFYFLAFFFILIVILIIILFRLYFLKNKLEKIKHEKKK